MLNNLFSLPDWLVVDDLSIGPGTLSITTRNRV